MSRSFAGGVIREIQIIAERLVPLMDEMSLDWEHALAEPAFALRERLLQFEASLVEANKHGTVVSLPSRDRVRRDHLLQTQSRG